MKPCTVIAIDLGGTKIAGALVRYKDDGSTPSIILRDEVPTAAQRGGEAVLQDIVQLCVKLQQDSDEPPVGAGIAAAGCINPKDGSVLYANGLMPGWSGKPLTKAVSQACGIPAASLGDVQGHALGESRWGAAKGLPSCLLVAVGTGLGGAFVIDGHVVRGAHGAAGHLGHMLHPAASGFLCNCGAQAHTEAVTSGTGIGAVYQGTAVSSSDFDPTLDGAEVSRRALTGEQKAIEALQACGLYLGQAIGSWANMLDPQVIILTGTVTHAGDLWRSAVSEGFAQQALEPLRNIPIIPATLGSDAPLIGAAEHLLDSLV